MPVTAKLSRKFYEVFGDEIANELVTWFNDVDATYRADLRQLNELNFARFDAKVDQRFAEADARLEQRFAEAGAKWEQRFAQLDAKWERRFAQLDAKWERRFAQLEAALGRGFAEQRADLLRWMFVYWGGSVVTTVGLVLLVLNAVR
ncbi:MAG TPA: hypothetical protein VGA37_16085 [Gemmatimonadales bacterium]